MLVSGSSNRWDYLRTSYTVTDRHRLRSGNVASKFNITILVWVSYWTCWMRRYWLLPESYISLALCAIKNKTHRAPFFYKSEVRLEEQKTTAEVEVYFNITGRRPRLLGGHASCVYVVGEILEPQNFRVGEWEKENCGG